jgi:hypothetical protein
MNASKIVELAARPGVKRVVVENFLASLGDLTYQEAVANCELDARSYRWNYATSGAIREGLLDHFFGAS